MEIVTRFAPSPTGFLHIGNARTALFSYLFAKHNKGKFLLRVEDTDRERSTDEAVQAIFDGLNWLGINWDEKEVFQFGNLERHKEIAEELLNSDKAYRCYLTPEELEKLREESKRTGKPIRSPWRDKPGRDGDYVVRLKTPNEGKTIVRDLIQGDVVTKNEIVDDLVIMRSDGTPTYMLAVVVDDHDMGVNHVVRGDDHLNNTVKQIMIYEALGWDLPKFAHMPLIHGPDGAKLSKRHGALGVMDYKKMGYLPETIINYLLRLGWSHGDDEIISKEQAIKWFTLDSVGKSPSRLDFKKLENLNAHYMKEADNDRLVYFVKEHFGNLDNDSLKYLKEGMDSLKQRAKTLNDLFEASKVYTSHQTPDADAQEIIDQEKSLLEETITTLENIDSWSKDDIMGKIKEFAESKDLKLGKVAGVIRAALTGRKVSPSVFEIMQIIGKQNSLERLRKYV